MNDTNPFKSPAEELRGACVSDSELEFDYTLQDAIDFSLHENLPHLSRAVRRRRILLFGVAVFFTLTALARWRMTTFPGMVPPETVISGMFATYFALMGYLVRRRVEKSTLKTLREMLTKRSNSSILGQQTVTLSDDGIATAFPGGTTFWEWWAIAEIDEDARYGYIYVSSIEARVIPKWAFATDAHFDAFLANARRLRQQHSA